MREVMWAEPGLEANVSWPSFPVPPSGLELLPPPQPTKAVAGNCSSEMKADFHTRGGERMYSLVLEKFWQEDNHPGQEGCEGRLGDRAVTRLSQRESAHGGGAELTLYQLGWNHAWLCPFLVVKTSGKSFYSLCFLCKIQFKGLWWGLHEGINVQCLEWYVADS